MFVIVEPVPPLLAATDAATTGVGVPVTIPVLDNDRTMRGTIALMSVEQPFYGNVSMNGDGSLTYSPAFAEYGTDAFRYTITNGAGQSATGEVLVRVIPVITTRNDAVTTDIDTSLIIRVLDNDSSPHGALEITGATEPAHGRILITASDTRIRYTPDPGYSGEDTFQYGVIDAAGNFGIATVTVTTLDPLRAEDDNGATVAGSPLTLAVLANDTGGGTTLLYIEGVTQGEHGQVFHTLQTVTYLPEPGFSGEDSFTYTVTDGAGRSASATVHISITATLVVVENDHAMVASGSDVTLDLLANDSHAEGEPLHILGVTQGRLGTVIMEEDGVVRYTARARSEGEDLFLYIAADPAGNSAIGIVRVEIAHPVQPADDIAEAVADTPVTIAVLANDTHLDGLPLHVEGVTQGSHGATSIEAGQTVLYTPERGFVGEDSFTYTAADENGRQATASVTVTVLEQVINADDDEITFVVPDDRALIIDVLANDSHRHGLPLSVTQVTPVGDDPVHITPEGTLVYTPSVTILPSRTFTFEYTASDPDGNSDTATVTVHQIAVPAPGDDIFAIERNTVLTSTLTINDFDFDPGDEITIVGIEQGPQHGTVTLNADQSFTYIPDEDFTGEDHFVYQVTDGLHTRSATVTLTVYPPLPPLWEARYSGVTNYLPPEMYGRTLAVRSARVYLFAHDNYDAPDTPTILYDEVSGSEVLRVSEADGVSQHGVDNAGNIYTARAVQIEGASYRQVLARYGVDGNLLWEKEPETLEDVGWNARLLVDGAGNIYMVTRSAVEPAVFSINRYASDGNHLWKKELPPGFGLDPVTLDKTGNVYAIGRDNETILTLMIDASGNVAWSQTYSGNNAYLIHPHDVTIDAAGNVYVLGEQGGTGTQDSRFDQVTLKYSPDGALLWGRTQSWEWKSGRGDAHIAVDEAGNVYTAIRIGELHHYRLPNTGTLDDADWGILKYNADGALQWTRRFGNTTRGFGTSYHTHEYVGGLVLDELGNLYVAGHVIHSSLEQRNDAIVVKYSPDGDLVAAATFDEAADRFLGVDVDEIGNVYLASHTDSALIVACFCRFIQDDHFLITDAAPQPLDVLANDRSSAGGLAVVEIGEAQHGTATLNPDGTITYTPGDSHASEDSFTYTTVDAAGHRDTATVSITIESSDAPPACEGAEPSRHTLWLPHLHMVPIKVKGVTDANGDEVTITIDSIMQDEPVDSYFLWYLTPDGAGIGTSRARIRAEWLLGGNGRVYHIYFTAEDEQGATCSGEVLVRVPRFLGHDAIDDGPLYDSTSDTP